uniref:Plasmid pRiA4b Orf3-like domain-containing protein n=1 Tax=Magnetococcus massalia (strain MO-1) TaxID=451514 RepID=A0A1S7LJR4_MAGMO|nr:conserved protein of unknown function;putative plasmid pRiA4b ORF-3 family protein [Candidatus Magnetococcus massalia]
MMAKKINSRVYTIKITLSGIKPPIWRRIIVPDSTTLGQLHECIQASMGWFDGHLHEFEIRGKSYGPSAEIDEWLDTLSEEEVLLRSIFNKGIKKFRYVYDFGDNWQHNIQIEKSEPMDPDFPLPKLVTGRRSCPPEDIGGTWGYAEFLEALKNPDFPHRENFLEMAEEDFDPDFFNHAKAVKRLSGCLTN